MSTPLRDKLYSHILGMVERKTKLTSGFTEFYKENGGKEEVLKQLNLSKSGSWKKKLKELFPGEFSVSKKGTISRVGQSGAAQPNVLAKNDSKSTAKLVIKVDQVDESSLESHIQNWIKRVEGFSGKSKGRKGRKKISTDGVGKPCPTCNVQMVAGPKNGKPFMSTIEHIIPLSMGGDNTYTGEFPQLTAMCFACNQARNKVVQATKKSDRKELVRFLITQVYGRIDESLSAFMDVFKNHYKIQTGRTLEHKTSTIQEIHLIQAGFCGNNAVSTASLIFDMFGSHPVKSIILLEQREANLIDFEAWNPYAPEIILVPNGDDNLQLSALERVLSTTSKAICMIHPSKTSQTFERLLQSNNIPLLKPIIQTNINARTSIKASLRRLLPWNWFNWNKTPRALEPSTVLQNQKKDSEMTEVLEKIEPQVSTKSVDRKPAKQSGGPAKNQHPLEEFRKRLIKKSKHERYRNIGLAVGDIQSILFLMKKKKELSWSQFFKLFGLRNKSLSEKTVLTILEMAAVDYTTRKENETMFYMLNKKQKKLPVKEQVKNPLEEIEEVPEKRFSPEQRIVIDAALEKIRTEISNFEAEGKVFKASNLSRVYSNYNGGVEFKKLLGLPISTKLQDMFTILFGDAFKISGTSPNWEIRDNRNLKSTQEE